MGNQIVFSLRYLTKRPIERKDCVVMNSSSSSKKSYHIVINNGMLFKHRSENERFVHYLKRINPNLMYIDASVYSTNRNMRMVNQTKVDKGIPLELETMHFIKDTLIHNYNERIIPEILDLDIIEVLNEVPNEETDSEKTDFSDTNYENNFEYTEEEILELCSLLDYERGEYNDWIKIGTALKNAGYDWTIFEEVSKKLKNYDPMCNIEVKYNSLDESRGNVGCIINMVKEDNPEEYGRWKTKTRSSLLRNQRESETENQTETENKSETEIETDNQTKNQTVSQQEIEQEILQHFDAEPLARFVFSHVQGKVYYSSKIERFYEVNTENNLWVES